MDWIVGGFVGFLLTLGLLWGVEQRLQIKHPFKVTALIIFSVALIVVLYLLLVNFFQL
jgi:hypothetical protein